MKCPGQDSRYWKPEDIFQVACPACGGAIEFFKDDARLACPTCKTPVDNPRVATGCALWCGRVRECRCG